MSGYRWIVLALGVVAQGAAAALFQGLPAIAPALRADLDLTVPQTGIAMSVVLAGMTLTVLPWGVLADRIGERLVIPAGLAAAAAAVAGAAAARSFWPLAVLLFVGGACAASANAASGRAVMGWFGAEERGLAMGIRQASLPVGGALAAAALPALAVAGGSAAALAGLAGGLALAAALGLGLRDAPAAPRRRGGATPLRDRRVWRLAGVGGLLVLVQYSFIAFLVLYLHEERGLSPQAAAAWLLGLQLTGAVARVVVGRLSDRAGDRIGPLRRMSAATAAAVAAAAALLSAPNAVAIPALTLAGLLASSWNGLAYTATAELAPDGTEGTAIGLQNTVFALGAALGAAGFGTLVALTSWEAAFAALAVLPLAAVVLLQPTAGSRPGRLRGAGLHSAPWTTPESARSSSSATSWRTGCASWRSRSRATTKGGGCSWSES